MIIEILNYKNVLENIPELLNNSPYKMNYIVNKTGISSPTFYRKLKNLSFTVDEVLKIVKILKPEEAALVELRESINRGKEDFAAGRVETHESVMESIKKDYFNV